MAELSGWGLDSADRLLQEQSNVRASIGDQGGKRLMGKPTVVSYREELRAAFEQLNRDWIETYFVLEEPDLEVFSDPRAKILEPGGEIFFVLEGGQVQGTCAVLRHSADECEIAKMAVAPGAR